MVVSPPIPMEHYQNAFVTFVRKQCNKACGCFYAPYEKCYRIWLEIKVRCSNFHSKLTKQPKIKAALIRLTIAFIIGMATAIISDMEYIKLKALYNTEGTLDQNEKLAYRAHMYCCRIIYIVGGTIGPVSLSLLAIVVKRINQNREAEILSDLEFIEKKMEGTLLGKLLP